MSAGERSGRPGLFLYEGRRLDEWLPEVVERIVERFDPLRVILFGSLARGEMGYDSDIDLLVVFEEVEWENKRELTVEIRREFRGSTLVGRKRRRSYNAKIRLSALGEPRW